MTYDYQAEKARIFTEDGQKMFLSIRDRVKKLIADAGSVRMDKAISGETGCSWQMLACVDRLVELGEIIEITQAGKVAGQHRIFTSHPEA